MRKNKFLFALAVLIGFIAVGGLGFFAMGGSHVHSGCIAAIAQGIDCPVSEDKTSTYVSFHLNTYKDISEALIIFGFILFAGFFAVLAFTITPFLISNFKIRRFFAPAARKEQMLFWISLHENSPSGI